jgi:hypothetical protein
MKVTRFFKLKRALQNLDVNYVANEIALLEDRLAGKGYRFDADNTAITYEGIYYIHPESGMAVRVALYDCVHPRSLSSELPNNDGYIDDKKISTLNEYHLLRCNALVSVEKTAVEASLHMAQRFDDRFYYRYKIQKDARDKKDHTYMQDIDNQKLIICRNCFMKVNSLLDGVEETDRENFHIKNFFDAEYFGSWTRYGDDYDPSESLANMYPKDWQEISRIRKEQVQHICEGCDNDFSAASARVFLHVHPTDYIKRRISYVKLECLCIGCLSDYPERAHFKNHPDLQRYQRYLAQGRRTDSVPDDNSIEAKKVGDSNAITRRRY